MSLDVVTSGNSYSDATNTMTVGSIDNCLMTDPPAITPSITTPPI